MENSNGEVRETSYFEAIFEAEQQEMDRDERVILIGEDIYLLTLLHIPEHTRPY